MSFLAQPPVPSTLIGVRTDRADVRGGERLHLVGFARSRSGASYRPATGEVRVSVVERGRTLAATDARLDGAGAFGAELALPADAAAGDAAVLATMSGASGGASIHVDGVGDVTLAIVPDCGTACPPDAPLPVTVTAQLAGGEPAAGRDVRVRVVRVPHVLAPDTNDASTAWGTTLVADVASRPTPRAART